MTAERELCDAQNEANQVEMHSKQRKEGTAGYVDPQHLQPWHGRQQEFPDDRPQQEEHGSG